MSAYHSGWAVVRKKNKHIISINSKFVIYVDEQSAWKECIRLNKLNNDEFMVKETRISLPWF